MMPIDEIKMKSITVSPFLSNLPPVKQTLVDQGNLLFIEAGSTKIPPASEN